MKVTQALNIRNSMTNNSRRGTFLFKTASFKAVADSFVIKFINLW